jgi:hypothetical protein
MHLIVTAPFAKHAIGEHITDAGEVAAILASENVAHVVKTAAPPAAPAVDVKPDTPARARKTS